ncbi:MAG TPA: ABC transporter substrate-binding protein [Streptosporangiaceae bacterium]|nr:ABC transporter substrate-binding protein [Streptosporangiaceae bacterium]
MRRLKSLGALVGAAGLVTAVAACGTSTSGSSAGSTLTISNESGSTWNCQFNPFNENVNWELFGPVYEPLVFMDSLESGKASPWLAKSWSWNASDTQVTFTMRSGANWQDGVPITAADVVYTFNLLKQHTALDLNADWSVLKSVVQKGSNQVVMTFDGPGLTSFYLVAYDTPIVPEHIWSKISNPVTYPDKNPVGSGAYTIGSCTPENIKFVANKHYYLPGEPKIQTVNYPAFLSNTPANQELADGQAQWGNQFIPSIQSFYSDKSPNNKYWFPPTLNNDLFINLTKPLLDNVAVREAMSYAIDRSKVSTDGEYGYEPPANQSGIVTPTFSSWLDTSLTSQYDYTYDPAKAEQILTTAGFTKGSNGIFQNSAGQLNFTVINIGGDSDFVADMQIVQQEFKAVGIGLTVDNLSENAFDSDLFNGDYQLAYYYETGGPTPYYEFRQWLDSANSAPIGQAASYNYERYDNPATDALLNEYADTTSTTLQHQIMDQLQQVMLTQLPVIPIVESVDWYEYNTGAFTGWPTPSNPYDQPGPAQNPDFGWTLLHLAPKK